MCALKSMFFDKQDHRLIALAESFFHDKSQLRKTSLIDGSLHPHGIIELEMSYSMRLAYAVMTLLSSHHDSPACERLLALRRIYDEVTHCAKSAFRYNTGRVLIELMKELIRAKSYQEKLYLAHDFHRAAQGSPRFIRKLLSRLHLLEMPEDNSQQTFDHHVHDVNTKGRKSPTHLVMDAWIKGIKYVNVKYYNIIDPEVADELLQAARIVNISARVSLEFRSTFKNKIVDFTWIPLGLESSEQMGRLLADERVSSLMEDYKADSVWVRELTMHLLDEWNETHSKTMAREYGIPVPAPLTKEEFLSYSGNRYVSTWHLGEYIYDHIQDALQGRINELRAEIEQCSDDAVSIQKLEELKRVVLIRPETIISTWLSPETNSSIGSPHKVSSGMPDILLTSPNDLVKRLTSLGPSQIVLDVSKLNALEVLELIWTTRGGISYLELFNLRNWREDKLQSLEAVNTLQRMINEGSLPALKHYIHGLLLSADINIEDEENRVFKDILSNLGMFKEFYRQIPLGSKIGSASVSKSSYSYGMGFAFANTLPPHAQKSVEEQNDSRHLRLPLNTDLYKYVHYHERKNATLPNRMLELVRKIPWMQNFGYRKVHGWALETATTRVQAHGNIVTLGGRRPLHSDLHELQEEQGYRHFSKWSYLNSNFCNILKVLCGFIPAQLAFYYTNSWWIIGYFGALIWFSITGLRNILQSMFGGGMLNSKTMLSYNNFIFGGRIADSLLYTGLSVPLLEVLVRKLLLEEVLQLTVQDNSLAVYSIIAIVNSAYIAGHNIIRSLQKEAIIGNIFRSVLAIPLAMVYGKFLFFIFTATGLDSPMAAVQTCAAITSKCASDTVAAIIEGYADKNSYIRLRQWDYSSKFFQIFRNYSRQEQLFPYININEYQENPEYFFKLLYSRKDVTLKKAVINMLDMMYLWYYQPRAQQVFVQRFKALAPEEQKIIYNLNKLLTLEKEISGMMCEYLVGEKFARALAFYLNNHDKYLQDLSKKLNQAVPLPSRH